MEFLSISEAAAQGIKQFRKENGQVVMLTLRSKFSENKGLIGEDPVIFFLFGNRTLL